MIEVDKLTKYYGLARALQEVSFSVNKGEIVGFLGPNGAGKSTTMKILTGFLLPTSGRATIAGLDVVEQSLQVRRRIGYLPESTPLYGEMRVDDYLRFCAEIRGVPISRRRAAVERAVQLCGLARVTGKDINELDKFDVLVSVETRNQFTRVIGTTMRLSNDGLDVRGSRQHRLN